MLTRTVRSSGEVATYLMLQHFPLTNAYLCQDCNSIGNSAKQCPACASEVLMSVSSVLNRAEDGMQETKYPTLPALTMATRSESAMAA